MSNKYVIGWTISVILACPAVSYAGKCKIAEPLRQGLITPSLFDKEVLSKAQDLQKCAEASMQSGFINRYMLKFKSGNRTYYLLNGQIVP